MKKYWKFTAIIAVIVLSLGTFFVTSATSATEYPEFVIKTTSGDESEVKPLVLDGSYADTSSMNYVNTNLKITANGSNYNKHSFLDQIIGQPPTFIKDLQEEYRSFMRGKSAWTDLFVENEEVLAYADVNYKRGSSTFTVSVLNKKDETSENFTMKVPESEKLSHIYVEDVQLVGNELNLVTQNYRYDDFSNGEKHMYTIDLSSQTITNHEAIVEVPKGQNDTYFDVQLIKTSPTNANEYLILMKKEIQLIEDSESIREEVINKEFISYNMATKEKEIINVQDLQLDSSGLSFYDGSTIYFTQFAGTELIVTPYSLEDDQMGLVSRVQLSSETDLVGGTLTTVKDGKLYVASTTDRESHSNIVVIVADLETGKTIYEGEVAVKDASIAPDDFELYINELFLK